MARKAEANGKYPKIVSYKDLIAWQKAMDFVAKVYQVTARFPREERYGLTGQLRRCAVSIPSNIAEGHGRVQRKDYIRFLDIARGSANEAETQLLIGMRLGLASEAPLRAVTDDANEIQRILKGLITKLQAADRRQTK